MNPKTIYGLFAALIGLLGVAAILLLTGGGSGDESLLLPAAKSLKATDIETLVVERSAPKAETYEFRRIDDKRWKLEKPIDARADGPAIDRVIDDLLALRKEGKNEPSRKLAEFGLEKPSLTVTLTAKGGKKTTIGLGAVTLGGASAAVFATSSERPGLAIPVRKSSLSSLIKTDGNEATSAGELLRALADFRGKDLLLAGAGFNPSEGVTSVKITEGANEIVLAKGAEGGWKFEKPSGYGPADAKGDGGGAEASGGVEGLILALAAIKPTNAEDLVDAPAELEKFGLAKDKISGPTVTVTRKVDKGDLKSETLYIGGKDEPANKRYVRLDGETTVAKVPAGLIEPITKLLARPAGLRDRQLFTFAPTGCDAIDIKLPGESAPVELRKLGSPAAWKLLAADGSEQNANTSAILDMLGALGGRPVKDFPDAGKSDAELGFDRPNAELTLYVGGLANPEKKEEGKEKDKDKEKSKTEEPKAAAPEKPKLKDPAARLLVGRRDKDLLYVRRIVKEKDGKEVTSDFALSETLRDKLTRGRLEFVDPTLPSFTIESVKKLEFRRGADEYLVERQEGKQPEWVIRKPADRADRPADPVRIDSLLGELSRLSVVRLWSEKPTERELERYGLKSPRLAATVSVKDGDKTIERVYQFGAETDDKTGYYAKQGDRDLVFVVARNAVPSLEAGEVRDTVIHRLDSGKVQSVKLTGWRDVVGSPTVRHLDRRGASNWALRGDAKIKLNPAPCEALLNAIALVRAEGFVVHRGGPKPEHKLDVAAGALEIVIDVDGDKEPITLLVGGVDAESKHYFATSSKLPGDVFLLPKGLFEAVKAKPGYFVAD